IKDRGIEKIGHIIWMCITELENFRFWAVQTELHHGLVGADDDRVVVQHATLKSAGGQHIIHSLVERHVSEFAGDSAGGRFVNENVHVPATSQLSDYFFNGRIAEAQIANQLFSREKLERLPYLHTAGGGGQRPVIGVENAACERRITVRALCNRNRVGGQWRRRCLCHLRSGSAGTRRYGGSRLELQRTGRTPGAGGR